MDRRHLVFAGLAVAAAGPAFAQTSPTPAGAMGAPEMDHAQRTLMVGSLALDTSKIALQKAQDEDVKEFAKFETDEQTTVAEILKTMDPSLMPKPDPKHAEMIQKLQAAKAGPAFDKDYLNGQIDGHRQLLAIQDDYLKAGKNREHTAIAKLVRGMVKEHLVLLDDIKNGMKG